MLAGEEPVVVAFGFAHSSLTHYQFENRETCLDLKISMISRCRPLLLRVYDMSNGGLASRQMKSFVNAVTESEGPVLGLDVGVRHIGVALSDEKRQIAFSQGGFRRGEIREDIARIKNITRGGAVYVAVVGMPTSSNGSASYANVQAFVRGYSQGVLGECGIHVIGFWDESFTTQLAKDAFMKRSKKSVRNRISTRKRVVDGVSYPFVVCFWRKSENGSNKVHMFLIVSLCGNLVSADCVLRTLLNVGCRWDNFAGCAGRDQDRTAFVKLISAFKSATPRDLLCQVYAMSMAMVAFMSMAVCLSWFKSTDSAEISPFRNRIN